MCLQQEVERTVPAKKPDQVIIHALDVSTVPRNCTLNARHFIIGNQMNKAEFVSRDLVVTAVAAPIDWLRLEELVCAVLTSDDFPALRKIGSIGDQGVDAIEECFYDGDRRIDTIVQVTSERAQRTKAKNTIAKLKKNGLSCKVLLFVTRHPVSSDIRRSMIDAAAEEGVTLEIRDSEYLIGQLSKPNSTIFSRFFGTAQQQLDALLAAPDPLQIAANDPLRHALLASLGAYVLSPHARLARNTLFDKTVLAALASLKGPTTREGLLAAVGTLVPEEMVDIGRLDATISRLCADGSCRVSNDKFECSQQTISQFAAVTQGAKRGYEALLDYIITSCKKYRPLNDAQLGYIERNVRRAVLHLLRAAGPIDGVGDLTDASNIADSSLIKSTICRDLPADVGPAAVIAFAAFTSDKKNAPLLAPLVRSYAAMAIRNLDPIGRRWQQTVLERSCVALDTDAVLNLMIAELPEHGALLKALKALQAHGVEILLPTHVFEEAVGHISRAGRTFRRFSDCLLRMPEQVVDARVWHAIVRGYFYASKSGFAGTPETFLRKYYDSDRQLAYSEHVLARRLDLKKVDLAVPSSTTDPLCFKIGNEVISRRETSRLKAQFRDADEMESRVWNDVRMALNLAERVNATIDAQSRGYLATEDRAYAFIERSPGWGERPSIRISTRALPQLANFICGSDISDDDVVRLLFDPISVAAAEQMAPDISVLTSIGVDLKDEPLDRLEWNLKHDLRKQIDTLTTTFTEEAANPDHEGTPNSAIAAFNTAKAAMEAGYRLVAPVEKLVSVFEDAVASAESERQKNRLLEEQLKALAEAALESTSKKGRRKVNQALRELGIELELPDDAEVDEP